MCNIKYLKSSAASWSSAVTRAKCIVPIQTGDVNRENTFPNRNRIHPKYVCTRTRENSARHALRYSIPIAFVGFPTYPHASSSLSALNPLSLLASLSFSLPLCLFLFLPPLSFSLSSFVSSRTYIHIFTWTAFWPRVPTRLAEGLLPVRAEISVRKFRSLAAFESTTKLDINLPDYPDAILCPSIPFLPLSLSGYE